MKTLKNKIEELKTESEDLISDLSRLKSSNLSTILNLQREYTDELTNNLDYFYNEIFDNSYELTFEEMFEKLKEKDLKNLIEFYDNYNSEIKDNINDTIYEKIEQYNLEDVEESRDLEESYILEMKNKYIEE